MKVIDHRQYSIKYWTCWAFSWMECHLMNQNRKKKYYKIDNWFFSSFFCIWKNILFDTNRYVWVCGSLRTIIIIVCRNGVPVARLTWLLNSFQMELFNVCVFALCSLEYVLSLHFSTETFFFNVHSSKFNADYGLWMNVFVFCFFFSFGFCYIP